MRIAYREGSEPIKLSSKHQRAARHKTTIDGVECGIVLYCETLEDVTALPDDNTNDISSIPTGPELDEAVLVFLLKEPTNVGALVTDSQCNYLYQTIFKPEEI